MASKFVLVLCLCIHSLYVSSLVPRLKDEYKPPRDYRPSKWISNSALDVWFGNKSMVDILAREFNQIVERIAARPGELEVFTKCCIWKYPVFGISYA